QGIPGYFDRSVRRVPGPEVQRKPLPVPALASAQLLQGFLRVSKGDFDGDIRPSIEAVHAFNVHNNGAGFYPKRMDNDFPLVNFQSVGYGFEPDTVQIPLFEYKLGDRDKGREVQDGAFLQLKVDMPVH